MGKWACYWDNGCGHSLLGGSRILGSVCNIGVPIDAATAVQEVATLLYGTCCVLRWRHAVLCHECPVAKTEPTSLHRLRSYY